MFTCQFIFLPTEWRSKFHSAHLGPQSGKKQRTTPNLGTAQDNPAAAQPPSLRDRTQYDATPGPLLPTEATLVVWQRVMRTDTDNISVFKTKTYFRCVHLRVHPCQDAY